MVKKDEEGRKGRGWKLHFPWEDNQQCSPMVEMTGTGKTAAKLGERFNLEQEYQSKKNNLTKGNRTVLTAGREIVQRARIPKGSWSNTAAEMVRWVTD